MRGPHAVPIELTEEQRQELTMLMRRRTIPHCLAQRARIILGAAAGAATAQIARQERLSVPCVRLWRQRWATVARLSPQDLSVPERLEDAPRPGRPAQMTQEQVCAIVAMACDAPRLRRRPISQWTSREISDDVISQGIMPTISPRHAARVLKRGACSHI